MRTTNAMGTFFFQHKEGEKVMKKVTFKTLKKSMFAKNTNDGDAQCTICPKFVSFN